MAVTLLAIRFRCRREREMLLLVPRCGSVTASVASDIRYQRELVRPAGARRLPVAEKRGVRSE
jgi:hypothetical protein